MANFGQFIEISVPAYEKECCDIEEGVISHSVTVTSYPRNVSVLNLKTEEVTQEWTLKGSHKISSAVTVDKKSRVFMAVTDQKVMRTWHEKSEHIEKEKKHSAMTFPNPVTKLHRCDKNCYVLYEDGTYTTTERIKDVYGKPIVDVNSKIIWSHHYNISNDEYVVFITKALKRNDMKVCTYKFEKELESAKCYECLLASPEKEVTCLSHCIRCFENQLFLDTLWSNGNLSKLNLTGSNSSLCKVYSTIPNLDKSLACISSVDQSQILVCGIRSVDGKATGLGVWDTSFHVVQAFHAFPEKKFTQAKVYYHAKRVILTTDKGLYICSLVSGQPNLGMVLGKFKAPVTTGSIQKLKQEIFDEPKSGKKASNTLKSSQVTTLIDSWVQQAGSDKNFKIPYDDIRHLVNSHLVNGKIVTTSVNKHTPYRVQLKYINSELKKILPFLISEKRIKLIYECLTNISDIAESSIIQCLNFYMRCEDNQFAEIVDDLGLTEVVSQLENCALPKYKVLFVNQLLSLPYNDVFMIENLRSVSFAHILILVGHLHQQLAVTISASSDLKSKILQPTLLQIVEWINVLFDAHFAQMILSHEARSLLVELHQTVQNKVEFFYELNSLEALLSQIKEKCALPKHKRFGPYCIETLHL